MLADYLKKKRFWQNLGINSEMLSRMSERQVFMLDQIMSIEMQTEHRNNNKTTSKH